MLYYIDHETYIEKIDLYMAADKETRAAYLKAAKAEADRAGEFCQSLLSAWEDMQERFETAREEIAENGDPFDPQHGLTSEVLFDAMLDNTHALWSRDAARAELKRTGDFDAYRATPGGRFDYWATQVEQMKDIDQFEPGERL